MAMHPYIKDPKRAVRTYKCLRCFDIPRFAIIRALLAGVTWNEDFVRSYVR